MAEPAALWRGLALAHELLATEWRHTQETPTSHAAAMSGADTPPSRTGDHEPAATARRRDLSVSDKFVGQRAGDARCAPASTTLNVSRSTNSATSGSSATIHGTGGA